MSKTDAEIAAMSDEEVMALDDDEIAVNTEQEKEQDDTNNEEFDSNDEENESDNDNDSDASMDEATSDETEDDESELENNSDSFVSDNDSDSDESEDNDDTESSDDPNNSDTDNSNNGSEALDFSVLLKPFKAGGKEMSIKTPEEALSLMKWGAQFHKKMNETAPYRVTAKILADNKIGNDELNYLIDLHKGNPEAIKKFAADNSELIDDGGFDEDSPSNYVPTQHNTNEINQILSIEDTLDGIQSNTSSATYDKLIDVATALDSSSKQLINSDPRALNIFASHIENGAFNVIDNEVTRQTALGNLSSKDYIKSYLEVAQSLIEQGVVELPTNNSQNNNNNKSELSNYINNPSKTSASQNNNNNNNETEIQQKRKAVAPTKRKRAKTTKVSDAAIANMSDDEFMAQFGNSL